MRKLFFEVKQFIVSLFRLLYVRVMEKERCECCGRELISMKGKCMICRENPVLKSTDCVIPLFSYRLWNRELMFRWKMQEERNFSPLFAKLLCEVLRKTENKIIVPVPPRKGKIRKNGWDQIEELCCFLEKRYGFRVLRTCRESCRSTRGQSHR